MDQYESNEYSWLRWRRVTKSKSLEVGNSIVPGSFLMRQVTAGLARPTPFPTHFKKFRGPSFRRIFINQSFPPLAPKFRTNVCEK